MWLLLPIAWPISIEANRRNLKDQRLWLYNFGDTAARATKSSVIGTSTFS